MTAVLSAALLAVLGVEVADAEAPTGSAMVTLAATQPDIVLFLTDDQTWDSLQFMPYLSALRDQGDFVAYPQLETNNALCCPSRASILTGLVDTRTGVVHNGAADSFDPSNTVGTALDGVGYHTGFFGKLLNGYSSADGIWPGWDDFQPVLPKNLYNQFDYSLFNNGTVETYGNDPEDYQVDVIGDKATAFIADAPADEPLFLVVAPTATHTPWVAAPRYKDAFAGTPVPLPPNFAEADVSDKPQWVRELPIPGIGGAEASRRKQAAAGLAVDDLLRDVDAALEGTGRAENTVLLFLSDNGLSAGAHRWTSKMCEFASCMNAPMMVRYPGQAARSDPRLVTNLDIAPTLAELAGTRMAVTPDGVSLVPAFEDPTGKAVIPHTALLSHWPGGDQHGEYLTEKPTPGFYAVRNKRWRYVELTNLAAPGLREYQLYDQIKDPFELVNLASDPAYAEVRADLQRTLYRMVRRTGADPTADQGSWRPAASTPGG